MKKQMEKRMRKKLFSIVGLLSIVALCGNSIVAEAEDLVTADGYQYQVLENGTANDTSDDTIEIVGYIGSETELVIPDTIDGKSVTTLGMYTFQWCYNLNSIKIPASISCIDSSVIMNCTSLSSIIVDSENVTYDSRDNCNAIIETASNELVVGCKNTQIPSDVTSIRQDAFYGCTGLTNIEIPLSVTNIGAHAFYGCTGLTSVEIPSGVTNIEGAAFGECTALISIEIPSSVESIGGSVFQKCVSLSTIIVDPENEIYDSRENCNAIIESATNTLITGCKNTKIPSDVTTISNYAFNGCTGLTSIEIPSSVESIGEYAFSGCTALTSIEIPSSVESIGWYAFSECSALNTINIDAENEIYDSRDNCNAIIESATNTLIQGCKNTQIPSDVIAIGEKAFYKCNGLTSITIPSSVKSIGWYAFRECSSLSSIEIPSSVKSIDYLAFAECSSLDSITVDSANTIYDSRNNCNAIIRDNSLILGCKNTKIPSDVTTISNYAFYGCSGLKDIEIPSSVTSIGESAFYGCSGLTSIIIPSSVKSIGGYAFYRCSNLNDITIPSSVEDIVWCAFDECGENATIYADKDSYAYKWAIENGIAVKTSNAEESTPPTETPEQPAVTPEQPTVTPEQVASTPAVAGTILTDITNACTVKVTSSDAANPTVEYTGTSDASAKKVSIPAQVTVDGITYAVTSIADKAFQGNKKVTQITIPKTVTTVGKNAFKNCTKLTKVTVDTGVTEIKASAFENCKALKSVTIKSKDLTIIGKNAFKGCKNLKTITIKSTKLTKKSISKNALKGTNKNLTIKVPKKMVNKYKTYFKNKGNKTVNVKKG